MVGPLDQLMSNQWVKPIFPRKVELIRVVVKCKILTFSKQLFIINKLSFIFLIIYPTLHSMTDRLGTVFAQPQLHFSVPHGSPSSISEPYHTASEYSTPSPVVLHTGKHTSTLQKVEVIISRWRTQFPKKGQ